MSAAQHTPTPWRFDGEHILGDRLICKMSKVHFENDNQTGYPDVNRKHRAEFLANAEHIVRCVNAHADLVALVRRVSCELGRDNYDEEKAIVAEADRLIDLLAKAEGRP